jgi:hypothetical protein
MLEVKLLYGEERAAIFGADEQGLGVEAGLESAYGGCLSLRRARTGSFLGIAAVGLNLFLEGRH